jgi:hypothetical protein
MIKPISVSMNFADGVGYIAFRRLREGERAHGSRIAPGTEVVADRDTSGAVIGIELLGLDSATLDAASAFALENGLEFPLGIRALAAA